MKLEYKAASGIPGGFFAEVDGYRCFIALEKGSATFPLKWTIQSGGGWTHRGPEHVITHCEGVAHSVLDAEEQLVAALEGQLHLSCQE